MLLQDPRHGELVRLSVAMNDMSAKAKTEKRGFTTDESSIWDKMVSDYDSIKDAIAKSEEAEKRNAELAKLAPNSIIPGINPTVKNVKKEYEKVFRNYLANGEDNLSIEDRQTLRKHYRIDNTMSTTTGSQGGYVIPQGFSDELERALKFFGGIIGSVTEWTTETGNPIPWPTTNDTNNMGRVIGQNTQVTNTDVSFGQVNFSSYILSSDLMLVPYALLQDSYFNINQLLGSMAGERLGRLLNHLATVGTGSGQPTGIVTAAVAAGLIYTAPTGETTSIAPSDFVNLEHTVDKAYRMGAKYMANDLSIKVIKNLKDSAGRPLWLPAYTGNLSDTIASEKLNGYELVTNNDMPVMAANATSFLFGRLDKYKLRRVGAPPPSEDLPDNSSQLDTGVTLIRLKERYADYMQVGFTAFLRADGNLVDAGTHPVAVFQNSAT